MICSWPNPISTRREELSVFRVRSDSPKPRAEVSWDRSLLDELFPLLDAARWYHGTWRSSALFWCPFSAQNFCTPPSELFHEPSDLPTLVLGANRPVIRIHSPGAPQESLARARESRRKPLGGKPRVSGVTSWHRPGGFQQPRFAFARSDV